MTANPGDGHPTPANPGDFFLFFSRHGREPLKSCLCLKNTSPTMDEYSLPRRKIFSEEDDMKQNMKDSKHLPQECVEIYADSNLAFCLETESFFVLMGEMTCCPNPQKGPRFLATMGVFTCIALLARSASGRAFAAHIPIGACFQSDKKHPFLEEVVVALKWAFRKESMSNVKVSLVGGQEAQDNNKTMGCRFSDMVKACVKRAGIHNVDGSLLNIFPGIPYSVKFEQMQALKNQSFQLVALDRETGHVVVHTRSEVYGWYSVRALGRRNPFEIKRYAESIKTYPLSGQRVVNVKW
jgi:hypothetical protein